LNTISFNKKQVKMVAHRGVSGLECENSCAAFLAAGNRSYFGIETDLHITKDGKYVVIHDHRTGRVSDVDLPVEESTWEELSKVRLYSDVKEQTPGRQDLVLPTLSDYIRICQRYDKVAVLELKGRIEPDHISGIIAELRRLNYLEKTLFLIARWDLVMEVRRLLPEQPIQFLINKTGWTDDLPQKLQQYKLGLDAHFSILTPERIALLHSLGVEVNVWTVNTPELGEEMVAAGVDYITTNILE